MISKPFTSKQEWDEYSEKVFLCRKVALGKISREEAKKIADEKGWELEKINKKPSKQLIQELQLVGNLVEDLKHKHKKEPTKYKDKLYKNMLIQKKIIEELESKGCTSSNT